MKKILQSRGFRIVLKDLAACIEAGSTPLFFALYFLGLICEPRPLKGFPGLREQCGAFAAEMVTLEWPDLRRTLLKCLPESLSTSFLLKGAGTFYEGFREKVVLDSIEYVSLVKRSRKDMDSSCTVHPGIAPFLHRFPEKWQGKRPKKRGTS